MSMYTARCVVVRCDVPDCTELAEMLTRDGATNQIPGWLEVYPFGTSSDLSHRKFICKTHAAALNLGSFSTPAEIPLSQAVQNPRFQRLGTLGFMAALDPKAFSPELLKQGSKVLEAATDKAEDEKLLPKGEK